MTARLNEDGREAATQKWKFPLESPLQAPAVKSHRRKRTPVALNDGEIKEKLAFGGASANAKSHRLCMFSPEKRFNLNRGTGPSFPAKAMKYIDSRPKFGIWSQSQRI